VVTHTVIPALGRPRQKDHKFRPVWTNGKILKNK
jgi:hypothetical protein